MSLTAMALAHHLIAFLPRLFLLLELHLAQSIFLFFCSYAYKPLASCLNFLTFAFVAYLESQSMRITLTARA